MTYGKEGICERNLQRKRKYFDRNTLIEKSPLKERKKERKNKKRSMNDILKRRN